MIQKPGAPDLSKIKSIRPISLLPLIGKTLEWVILKRLKHHNTEWFSKMHFGFNAHHSTELANFNLLSSIQDRLNKEGQSMALISLDITGAFDRAWNPAILYVNAFTAYTVSNLSTKIHTEF